MSRLNHQFGLRRMAECLHRRQDDDELCSIASPITAISSKPETTVGASRAVAMITKQPALAPSPQPRPAPTARALPSELVAQRGPFWMPIRGPNLTPIDIRPYRTARDLVRQPEVLRRNRERRREATASRWALGSRV